MNGNVGDGTPPSGGGTSQWGAFKSKSVERALREALADNHQLTHPKVVDIVERTLADDKLSLDELADLEMVADKSKSMSLRSKSMLKDLVAGVRAILQSGGADHYRIAFKQSGALHIACEFLKRTGSPSWPHLDRDKVGVGMILRILKPGLIDQADGQFCGPSSFLFNLLMDKPGQYVDMATQLFEKGTAEIHGHVISPPLLAQAEPLDHVRIAQVDYLTDSSLADMVLTGFGYSINSSGDLNNLNAATSPMGLAWWFMRAGYTDVHQSGTGIRHQTTTENLEEANRFLLSGYRVCLLINDLLAYAVSQDKSGGLADRHWVTLRSPIMVSSRGYVTTEFYTWGEPHRAIPQGAPLAVDDFLMNYYGYVAAKP